MAKNKTNETTASVDDFLDTVVDEQKREDSRRIIEIMKKQTKHEPKMWGPSIIGFGSYHYKYDSGHEGDAPLVGFSPRKDAISLYIGYDSPERAKLLEKFGKHKGSKGCVYIKKLEDIDTNVLKELIKGTVKHFKEKYPAK